LAPKKGEAKFDIGTQDPDQEDYQIDVESYGELYIVAYNMHQVREVVERAKLVPYRPGIYPVDNG